MFTKLIRIGRDAELRYTKSGKAVCGLVGAYDIGWGDKKKTQWIDVTIWGDKAESLCHMLLKGGAVVVTVDDLEVETFEGKNGLQAKLKGNLIKLEFAGKKPEEVPQEPRGQQQQAQTGHPIPTVPHNYPQQQQQRQQAPQQAPTGFDDFDDDIPF